MLITRQLWGASIKDDTVTIHQHNLGELAIEMCKISNDRSSLFVKDIIMTEIYILYNTRSITKVEKDHGGN